MRKLIKRPRLNPDEHPRPQVMVPMSIFGEVLFSGDHARVVVWDGDRERKLHTRLNEYRVGGEWFRYTDEVKAVIDTMETE